METRGKWPLPRTIESAWGCSGGVASLWEKAVLGLERELSEIIGSPVILLYMKGDAEKRELSRIVDVREEAKRNYSVCALRSDNFQDLHLREKVCDRSDNDAFLKVAASYPNVPAEEGRFGEHEKCENISYFRYLCPLGFLEWLIPVTVAGEFAGAFITGQFEGKENPLTLEGIVSAISEHCNQRTAEQQERIRERLQNSGREAGGDANHPFRQEPSKDNPAVQRFFQEIARFQEELEWQYKRTENERLAEMRDEIVKVAWGREGIYKDDSKVEERWGEHMAQFAKVRTHMLDAMVLLRDYFSVKEMVIYKPRKDPRDLKNERGLLAGADISDRKEVEFPEENTQLEIDRDFLDAAQQILIEEVRSAERADAICIWVGRSFSCGVRVAERSCTS